MEYAIQYPDWRYAIDSTPATVDEIASVIGSHPWQDGLAMFERLKEVDKAFPVLDAGDDARESMFFCACREPGLFDVSICHRPTTERPKLTQILRNLFKGALFMEFERQTTEQAVALLRVWASTSDAELEHVLKKHKGAPTTNCTLSAGAAEA